MRIYKITFLFLTFFVPWTSFAKPEELGKDIKIFTDTPSKAHTIISPISASKRHVDDAFKKMKEKAAELGADAIIDLNCKGGEKVSKIGSLLASDEFEVVRSRSICEGFAVKWD